MVNIKDKSGEKFGLLKVLNKCGFSEKAHSSIYLCECECGNFKEVLASNLNKTYSCGCVAKQKALETKRGKTKERHIGESFNDWLVISWDSVNENNTHNYLVEHTCGAREVKRLEHLKRDTVRCNSCEVAWHFPFPQETDGISQKHKLYQRWYSMVRRCYCPFADNYYCYGAVGIDVCEGWRHPRGFLAFKSWIEENYPNWEELFAQGYQLDRKDGTKGYSPDNVRLIDAEANNLNKKHLVMVEWQGAQVPLIHLISKYSKHSRHTVWGRINRGWSVEDALMKPLYGGKSE